MPSDPGNTYRALKRDITNFRFKPGERLLEEHLSDRYGVSRTPIREALRRLEQEGLIVSRGNVGKFIPHFDVLAYEDIYRVRIALEELAAVQACSRADNEEVEQLRRTWRAGFERGPVPLDGSFVEADERFHVGVAKLSRNSYLVESLQRINDRLRFIRITDFTVPHRLKATKTQHERVLDAILQRDEAAARTAIGDHIRESERNVRDLITRALSRIYLDGAEGGRG